MFSASEKKLEKIQKAWDQLQKLCLTFPQVLSITASLYLNGPLHPQYLSL